MVTELETPRSPGRMRRWFQRMRQTETGQTLVEFSMVLPLILLLLFAIVDFGRAMYAWSVLGNAAREGGRTAALGSNTSTVNAAITTAATGLNTSDLVLGPHTNIGGTKGSTVTVNVQYNFEYVTPISGILEFLGADSLANPTLSASTSMRLE